MARLRTVIWWRTTKTNGTNDYERWRWEGPNGIIGMMAYFISYECNEAGTDKARHAYLLWLEVDSPSLHHVYESFDAADVPA